VGMLDAGVTTGKCGAPPTVYSPAVWSKSVTGGWWNECCMLTIFVTGVWGLSVVSKNRQKSLSLFDPV